MRLTDHKKKELALSLMVVAFAQPLTVLAQVEGQPVAPAAGATPAVISYPTVPVEQIEPRNGYAETLRPSRRAVARPGGVIENRPYAPISRPDDEGQIPEIEMFVGESRVFPTPGVARIAVGNGSLLTAAALDGKEVILFANGAGTSSLFIWNADGRYQRLKISIVPGDTTRHAREIAAFLSTMPNTRASVVGANIIVEGDDLSDDDQAKIEVLSERYPQIVNFTNRVGWERMITMDVKIVEFPVSALREIGLKWTSTGGAAIAGIWSPAQRGNSGPYEINILTGAANPIPITGPNGTPAVIPNGLNAIGFLNLGLNAQLDLLAQEGKATVLSAPQLSARNGSTAEFLAGGEIPYAVATRDGIAVQYKSYGVKLEITPRIDRNGVIRATIDTEVSSIDGSFATVAGPALLTRSTKTEFNVRDGESMVLAGLLQREVSTSVDKVPLLGDIPVLGALFRSKRFQNRETELVIFVTPTIVTAQSTGNTDRIERTTQRLEERLGPKPYLSEPLQPEAGPERPSLLPVVPEPAASGAALPKAVSKTEAAMPGPIDDAGSRLTVTADATALRAAPSERSSMLLALHRGATVHLGVEYPQLTGSTTWHNVVVGAVNGWVPGSAVRPLGTSLAAQAPVEGWAREARSGQAVQPPLSALASDVPEARPRPLTLGSAPGAPARRFVVGLDGLALRMTPDVNSMVVLHLKEGRTVVALPQAPRGAWTAVQAGEGESRHQGWVPSQWLQPLPAQ